MMKSVRRFGRLAPAEHSGKGKEGCAALPDRKAGRTHGRSAPEVERARSATPAGSKRKTCAIEWPRGRRFPRGRFPPTGRRTESETNPEERRGEVLELGP